MPRPRAHLDPSAVTAAFAPDGLHGATSQTIARCAGLAKPTVYARGGSKEAIFLACVDAEVERLLTAISRADLDTRLLPARTRLAVLAEAIIDHGRGHPAAARLLHLTARHTSSRVAGDVNAALARLPARLASILRRDTTPACADLVAQALLGAAGALAVSDSASERSERGAALLGRAFAAVLEPVGDTAAVDAVHSVGLY